MANRDAQYDSECDYEEEDYDYDEEDDEEEEAAMPVPAAALASNPRKRGHSELREETPCPIPQRPQAKRMRLANMPPVADKKAAADDILNKPLTQREMDQYRQYRQQRQAQMQAQQQANAAAAAAQIQAQILPQLLPGAIAKINPPLLDIPKTDYNQTLRPLYTPEHVMASVSAGHPFAEVLVRALVDIMYRFRDRTSEKNLAVMATRMWREPREASMYDVLSDKNKQLFFEKWVSEVRLGRWQRPEETRATATAAVSTTTAAIHRLRPDALKQIDASSKGRLDERVRLWLNNIQPC